LGKKSSAKTTKLILIKRVCVKLIMISLFKKSKLSDTAVQELVITETETEDLKNSLIYNIPVQNILPNPNQPRKNFDEKSLYSLAQSIKDYGIIQPITVRLVSKESSPALSLYELISGERRLRAVKLLLWETVPCVIINTSQQISAEIAIIENLQREDLDFFEQAKAVCNLIELFGYTQEQTAKKLAVSQSYIANKLRILKLTEAERKIITEYGLTERHARSFIRIANIEERKKIIETVIKHSMNVSATDKYIDKILDKKQQTKPPKKIFIVKDIRLFLNTIDKVVDTIAQSGVDIKSEKTDRGEYIEIYLNVPKKKN